MGSVPKLFAVVLEFPVSPAVPPSVCTAGQGALPDVPRSTLGPTSSIDLGIKSKIGISLNSFDWSISLS